MKGILFVFALLLMLQAALPSLALTGFYTPPHVGKIVSSINLASTMNYTVRQINATEIVHLASSTSKTTTNSSNTNSSNNTQIKLEKINSTYTVNYSVIKYNSYGNLTISIAGNFTNQNISFFRGNYSVDPELVPFTLEYPFTLSQYLFNSTYAIAGSSSSVVYQFLRESSITIDGQQEEAFKYTIHENGFTYNVTFLEDGAIYNLQNSTFNMTLQKLSTFTLNLSDEFAGVNPAVINSTYQYAIYEFSQTAGTLLPSSDIEVYYPILFSNDIVGLTEFQLTTQYNSSVVASRTVDGLSLYNYLSVNMLNSTFTTFSPYVGQKNITFNGDTFLLVNQTKVSTIAGTYDSYLYENVTSGGTLRSYLYLSHEGLLLELKEVTNSTGTPLTEAELVFLGNNYISPNVTFPYHSITNTNLPYEPVNSYDSFLIAVIVTLAIVVIAVLLHRKLG